MLHKGPAGPGPVRSSSSRPRPGLSIWSSQAPAEDPRLTSGLKSPVNHLKLGYSPWPFNVNWILDMDMIHSMWVFMDLSPIEVFCPALAPVAEALLYFFRGMRCGKVCFYTELYRDNDCRSIDLSIYLCLRR